jgi:hypothetical protein
VNLLRDNIDTIKKNTETLIGANKEVGLEIHVEKTKYMFLSRHQNVGQNRDIKIASKSFKNVSQFKYLGITVTDQNLIQEEIKRRLNSGNTCQHSVQNLLSSRLLSKNLKIRIYKTITLPLVLYGCKTWSLTLRKEHRLKVFENRVLRRIFGPKRDKVTGEWRKLHNEELRDSYSSPRIIRMIKSRGMRWAGHVARTGEKRSAYRLLVGKAEGKIPLEDQDIGGQITLEWILERWDGVMWTGLVWLRLGTGGELL